MATTSFRWLAAVLCCAGCAHAPVQDSWKHIAATYFGKPVRTMEAIAVSAVARYEGRALSAWVLIYGRQKSDGPGYVHLGVLVKGIRQVISATDLDQFSGPDLSPAVLHGNPLALTIVRAGTTRSIETGVVFTGLPFEPGGIPAHEQEYFETVFGSDNRATDDWKAFVVDMRDGFERGRIEIGGDVLKHRLIVEFSGKGIRPLLTTVMEFAGQ